VVVQLSYDKIRRFFRGIIRIEYVLRILEVWLRTIAKDYVVSLDPSCNGNYIVGLEGYGYAKPVAGVSTVAVYSCSSAHHGHFVSKDARCEGNGAGTLLGYLLP
jgi:hypothetical protein